MQRESECAEGKRRIMIEIAYSSESGMYFERDRVPGMYCSTGKAQCTDLDFKKDCQCPSCLVWTKYGLKDKYYCQYGEP
ncbi:MAG: DUF2769 domain-containing protein [Methanobacterium sp.]|nr:DUF2769 domain-containing protein [Methanobacterium sp.]